METWGESIRSVRLEIDHMRWRRHRTILGIGWKWTVTIDNTNKSKDIFFWCKEHFKKLKIEGRVRTDVMKSQWVPVYYKHGGFCYRSDINIVFLESGTAFPNNIRIWIKDDADAAAFKLRWM